MIAVHLARWLVNHAPLGAGGLAVAIKHISRYSTSAAATLLDYFPEVDTAGMQTWTPDPRALRELGKRDGNTHSLKRVGTIDDQIASGEWDSGPAQHVIKFDFDEWVHVLEGEAHVTVQGETRTIKAGDVALFRAGLSMTWDVPKYIRKVWVHRYPQPGFFARAARAIERRVPGLSRARSGGARNSL